jgi:hypothetical protein
MTEVSTDQPDNQPDNQPHLDDPRVPRVPSFAAMVALPAVTASVANFWFLASSAAPIAMRIIGSIFMGALMAFWMNRKRKLRLAAAAKISANIETFGQPPAPSGGWANPNRTQRFERWFDRNRPYRRR